MFHYLQISNTCIILLKQTKTQSLSLSLKPVSVHFLVILSSLHFSLSLLWCLSVNISLSLHASHVAISFSASVSYSPLGLSACVSLFCFLSLSSALFLLSHTHPSHKDTFRTQPKHLKHLTGGSSNRK